MNIVPLSEAHIPPILTLMTKEGWYYYDHRELKRYIDLNEACFTLLDSGRVAGCIFSTNYGNQAWLGNIVVAAQSRGLGRAAELIRTVTDHLHSQSQGSTFRLGSVPLAIGLYEKAGFLAESFNTAQQAALPLDMPEEPVLLPNSVHLQELKPSDLASAAALDAVYFKSARLKLLTQLYGDSLKAGSLCLKADGELVGFIMVRRRLASKTEGGFSDGPDHVYRLGPCCVLPEYGISGFKALLNGAIQAVNNDLQERSGTARIYVVFPKNPDPDAPGLSLARSAKSDAQWQYMAQRGFQEEYFEQVMSCSRGETDSALTLPDTDGIFASATPGDKG